MSISINKIYHPLCIRSDAIGEQETFSRPWPYSQNKLDKKWETIIFLKIIEVALQCVHECHLYICKKRNHIISILQDVMGVYKHTERSFVSWGDKQKFRTHVNVDNVSHG